MKSQVKIVKEEEEEEEKKSVIAVVKSKRKSNVCSVRKVSDRVELNVFSSATDDEFVARHEHICHEMRVWAMFGPPVPRTQPSRQFLFFVDVSHPKGEPLPEG